MSSTLIIGLGGTGAKTVIHIKKMLMDSRPNGDLPPDVKLLVIDTEITPTTLKDVGPWMGEYASREQMDLKNIQIHPVAEYYALIGNLYGFAPDHAAWYDSAYFNAHPDAVTLLSVTNGAGMYRQVGRLALFYHMRNGETSALYHQLSELIGGFPEATCRVILTGSLAGGTGAALFIDIAHLVRVIAENNSKTADVTAALVLPEAFAHQPGVAVGDHMRARGLAALRELDRFMSVHLPEIGFNMQYTDRPGNHTVNQRTKGSPFSLVYLMEKTAPNDKNETPHPLTVSIDKGIAPMMATWIAKLCDDTVNTAYLTAKANITFLRNNAATSGLTTAFVSSFGTYSVVLPLAAMVEDWSLRLAEEAVKVLVPEAADPKAPILLADTELANAPGDSARTEGAKGCSLLRDATDLGARHSLANHPVLVEEVKSRSVKLFSGCFTDANTTPEETAMFERMNEENTYFKKQGVGWPRSPYTGALCSPLLMKNQPVDIRAMMLHDSCETQYAGLEANWKPRLEAMVNRQTASFVEETIQHCAKVLNGSGTDKPMDAYHRRYGRLPWLIAYIQQRKKYLEDAIWVLDNASTDLQAEAEDYARKGWMGGLMGQVDLKTQMAREAGKQHDYLSVRQQWLERKRKQLLVDSERAGLRRMLAYLVQLEERLTQHRGMLTGEGKLLKTIQTKRKTIAAERQKASETLSQVREVVSEPQWEEEMYSRFCQPDPNAPPALHRVLEALQWEAENSLVNGAPVPRLKLRADGIPVRAGHPVLNTDQLQIGQNQDTPEPIVQNNLTRLSELTRPHFSPAWGQLSVVDPFIWRTLNIPNENATRFGERLKDRCNVMLTPGKGKTADTNTPTNVYLLAPAAAVGNPVSNAFLTTAFGYLLTNIDQIQAKNSQVLAHGDPTTLTYFIMQDGIELRKIAAFTDSIRPYLTLPAFSQGTKVSRATNHIFRAEKSATQYETTESLLTSRVAMSLENRDLLTDYLLAWAFKHLKRTSIATPAGVLVNILMLGYSRQENALGVMRTVACASLLSDPAAEIYQYYPVEYITAAEAYMLRDKDYNGEPMDPVRQRLHELMESALDEKVKELEPQWRQGDGTAAAVAAAASLPGDQRDRDLKAEARKHMYRLLDADLAAWDLGEPTGLDGKPVENKSREAEKEFIRVLRSWIQLQCKS